MALLDIYACWSAQSGTLRAKFIAACLKAAYDISNEDGGTANHANRVIWANVILLGTAAEVEEKASQHLRYAMASNSRYRRRVRRPLTTMCSTSSTARSTRLRRDEVSDG